MHDMNTFIALLRGVNVGGHHKLPMRELAQLLAALGLHNVQTYIQSGNVVFQTETSDPAALSQMISRAIGQSHGFTPQVFILDVTALRQAITANPFPEGAAAPQSLHLFFLDDDPATINWEALEVVKRPDERYALVERVFYLHAPDGIGRSKLAEKIGQGWGVAITGRNWRTVSQLMNMATAVAATAVAGATPDAEDGDVTR